MKVLFLLSLILLPVVSISQTIPVKHPRVAEVEEKMRDEASRYFTRRFPNEPFFIKVEINPLRRDMIAGNQKAESLPYFDYESDESVDEWDDPKTPTAFLRHRVTKVTIEIDVPEKFDDARLAEIKEEISAYLKLLPYRDDVKVVRKLKGDVQPFIPNQYYVLIGAAVACALLIGLLFRSGVSKMRSSPGAAAAAPAAAASFSPAPKERVTKAAPMTGGSGVTTMHDPLKTVDIVHMKIEQIGKSGTFPTLGDILTLHAMGESNPSRLGALLYEMPGDWQKSLFPLGHGQNWLEAFTQPGPVDHECLVILDRISKERNYAATSRESEDLLIQIWRMEEKGISFFKKIPQEHAFNLLHMLPKSLALGIAKKTFPGVWGRLLENVTQKIILSPDLVSAYKTDAMTIEPAYEWQMLENYRKDRELLSYLDQVNIDDEKDIYNTLNADSFIFRVRPGFYKVFEAEAEVWKDFVAHFPLDQWAMAIMNSPRSYIRQVMDALDDKQKVVLSQNLKMFDQGFDSAEQVEVRRSMASYYAAIEERKAVPPVAATSEQNHAQSA